MIHNEALSRQFSSVGGGLAGATISSFRATPAVLEVELRFPHNQGGQVVFMGVVSLRSKGDVGASLRGGWVFDLEPRPGRAALGDSPVRQFEFVADVPVLEVVAASFELSSFYDDDGWRRIFAYLERELAGSGALDWTKPLESLSVGYRGSMSIHWIDAEQGEVGLSGILSNGTRRVFENAIACYERLGQVRMSDILKSALIVSGSESPALWKSPPSRDDFDGFEPLSDDLDELDALYGDERTRLPVAGEWDERDLGIYGTIEHYWRTYPEDFQPAPE
jgi:hypothetical protein